MHELFSFLDILCIMSSYLFLRVDHLKKNLITFSFHHNLKLCSHQAKWLGPIAHLQEYSLIIVYWMWELVDLLVCGALKMSVKDQGVEIGLEKLELNKMSCSCYLVWCCKDITLIDLKSFFLLCALIFEPLLLEFLKIYLRTSKGLVWRSWYLVNLHDFNYHLVYVLII